MSFLGNVGKFFGGLFGGEDEEKKKRQQQQQQGPTRNFQSSPTGPSASVPAQPQSLQPQTSQQQTNGLNLVLPTQTPGTQNGLPDLLRKAASLSGSSALQPQPQMQPQPKPEELKKSGPSVWHKLTHNPVTDFAGGVVKPIAEFGHAVVETPHAIYREIQNKPINDIQQNVFGTTDSGTIAKKIVGDTVNVGLTVAAPGLSKAGEGVVAKALPSVIANGTLRKVIPKVAADAAIGAGFGGNAAFSEGGTPEEIAKSAAAGAAFGGGGRLLFEGAAPLLRKALPGRSGEVAPALAPDEAAPGIRSVNPSREADAAVSEAQQAAEAQARAQAQAAAEDLNKPAYLRKAEKSAAAVADRAATDARAAELGAGPSALDRPAFQHKQDIQAVVDQGTRELNDWVNSNPGHTPQQLDAARTSINNQVVEQIAKLQNERIAGAAQAATPTARPVESAPVPNEPASQPVVPAAPTPEAPRPPEVPTSPEPTVAELSSNQRPAAALQKAIEDAHNAGNDAEAARLVDQLPEDLKAPMRSALNLPEPSAAAPSVDVAPRSHDQLVKQLGPAAEKNFKGQYSKKLPLNIEELKQNAAGAIANMSDEQVLQTFQGVDVATMITDSQSFSLARAALDRLSKMADNPQAVQQVTNIMDAMDRYVSKSGEALRIAQEEFDNMPLPMKVRYLVKKIDAANVETKGYEPLARDPAKAAEIEAALTNRLQAAQDVSERIAALENQLNAVADAAKNGERSSVDVRGVTRTLKTERRNLQAANGEVVKFFQDLIPGRTKAQKALVDFPKRMMLASFTGRLNDILTTTANVGRLQAQNFTQGLLSKAVNLFKPGTVTDTFRGGGKLFRGAKTGLVKTAGEIKGTQYVGNLERSLRGNEDLRSGLRKARGPVGRTIQAATEAATNVSEGVRDQRLYQLAHQEGRQAGLTGDLLTQYAEARSAVPSRQMLDSAEQLHLEVNNLNENPITRTLNRISAGIEGKSALGGVLKNQIMPFTSWLGGNIYNTITDKNVVASTIKLGRDLLRGDAEGAVRNAAKTINGAAEAYALGYALTKAGLLTNQNAEGYNDGGVYVHAGDRYIPVGFFGFFAPNIIMGNAVYNGIENNGGENPAKVVATNLATNLTKSVNLAGALGVETNISRSYDALTRPGGSWGDAAAQFTGSAAGQFVPAAGSDVNAVLNNQDSLFSVPLAKALNPTHEAANTKVENPSSPSGHAKDYPKSSLASFMNRIPFLSQTLPRKAGVAAPDLVDRTTRGDRATQTQKDAAVKARTEAQQAADWKTRDIPNFREKGFDDKVEARVQRGEYDKAIEALQAKLDDQKKNKDIPDSKNSALADEIKTFQVLKGGKYDPKIRDLYKSTSLTEWRNMGDPESDTYDPKTYQKLYDFDSALAKENVSGSSLDKSSNKYAAKKPGKGHGRGSSASSGVRSNKISSTPSLGKFSFDLKPEKAGSYKAPVIQPIRSSDLIKKRKITVSKP